MTTKPKAPLYRLRRGLPPAGPEGAVAAPVVVAMPARPAAPEAADPFAFYAPGAEPGAPTPGAATAPPQRRSAVQFLRDSAAAAAGTPAEPMAAPQAEGPPMPPDASVIPGPDPEAASRMTTDSPALVSAEQSLENIRREGLTGRQLRLARRVAQKHGIAVTSDFDAVRQLRGRGIDPFQRATLLELVQTPGESAPPGERVQLPQTVPQGATNLPSTQRVKPAPAEARVSEVMKIQRDIARRRRRKSALLMARLSVFVLIPTILVSWYFAFIATPLYATKSDFVIQQAESAAAAGLGGLFQGTSMATQQDSLTVQSYLTSRAAFARLEEEIGFREHFEGESVDPIQRLPQDATNEEAYRLYSRMVRIGYDPTEGIIRMEVIAPDPALSQRFSEALIGYAEEQVDQLTQRLREDQMRDARQSYEEAEAKREAALQEWLRTQTEVQQIDPIGETAARTAQISALETERQQLELELQTRLDVARPNEAQVNSLRSQIANIEGLITEMRAEMTQATEGASSLAAKNTELRLAEENYTFQTLMVQQALQQMEMARVEANRQVRYLSVGVAPIAPDEATYPRVFENSVVALLVFAGIYLMLSLTASILREQVTS